MMAILCGSPAKDESNVVQNLSTESDPTEEVDLIKRSDMNNLSGRG